MARVLEEKEALCRPPLAEGFGSHPLPSLCESPAALAASRRWKGIRAAGFQLFARVGNSVLQTIVYLGKKKNTLQGGEKEREASPQN